ncbi:MAG: AbrB/MazE/SpoVT family DNA-binding domain-containing protein [Thaumarchaeota archaeon]|nr:AbrB/MazE/SpoVT family DNA-binding domain-containing protein [Nitrososphaerota archaeon]
MKSESESVVGSKEELYPPKKLRKILGLRPGVKVRYRIEGRKLLVEPIPSVGALLEADATVTISKGDARAHRRELSSRLEGRRREW